MTLEEFKGNVIILSDEKAAKLRRKYIEKFVDQNSDHYKNYLEKLINFSDGECYTGYIWDCLISFEVIKFEAFFQYKDKLNKVFVFWDNHSQERIFIEDYWKFGKKSVLSLDYSLLLNHLEYLPEDIYIFDETLNWALILTHEEVNGERWCLRSGNIN